jgi:hypothetical protein
MAFGFISGLVDGWKEGRKEGRKERRKFTDEDNGSRTRLTKCETTGVLY